VAAPKSLCWPASLDSGDCVHGRIVPVEEQLLLDHQRPLLLEMLQDLAQNHHGVVGIDDDAPGDNVGVQQLIC
jgi:hypothetical protein